MIADHDEIRVRYCRADGRPDGGCSFYDAEFFECTHPNVPPDAPRTVGRPDVGGYFDSVPDWCPLRKRPALVRLDDADGRAK